ncbi:MAG: exonuclease domain-containing protein, partial [Patescibacteria group bacterium]|nr:exonuclease domain-containing protein [Patescibacteria group bacterium]
LDVEATGLLEEDKLVQVAYDFEGVEKEEMFNPEREMSIEAMEVTHITNKHLEDKETFQGSDFYNELKGILDKDDTIFVAHNAPYDISMIEREKLKVSKSIDTYKIAQALDVKSEIPSYRLQYLRYYMDLDVDAAAHDALGDVRVLRAIFERMQAKMCEKDSHDEVIAKMIKITSEPMLIKRLTFGKHRGDLVADVARSDRGWLEWLLREKESAAANGDIDEDWIYTLKHYLK